MGSNNVKYTYEQVKEFLNSVGVELLSKEYINNKSLLEVRYKCGHVAKSCFGNLKTWNGCKICNRKGNPGITEELAQKRLASHYGGNVVMTNYKTQSHKANFECLLCGNKWTVKAEATVMGYSNCPQCAWEEGNVKKRIPMTEVLKELKELGCIYLSGTHGRKQKLTVILPCGHVVEMILTGIRRGNCNHKDCHYKKGSESATWKGGVTPMKETIHVRITNWKKESAKKCNYKCAITGEVFHDIHHLQPLSRIILEAQTNLGLLRKKGDKEYTPEQFESVVSEAVRLHDKYPLGVCLTKTMHKLFHNLYGNRNNTPSQFYEFQSRIKSGEIKI